LNTIEKYRDAEKVKNVLEEINKIVKRKWTIMEICGGQTHAIMHYGLDGFLPKEIELVHGPGCPVCVTSLELIDKAQAIASQSEVIFTTFGDMLRVPGSKSDLFALKADGADVRVVYSPLDAVQIAKNNTDKQVVFFAIGFETTAPPNLASVLQAKQLGIKNYSILVSQVRVPPAIELILNSPHNLVQGLLAPGHVCAVMGYWEYLPIAERFKIPITVTGFEPLDLAQGILQTVRQLECGTHNVSNAYSRVVSLEGNVAAQKMIQQAYEGCDRIWRGIGLIPNSGWKLNNDLADFDAEKRYQIDHIQTKESHLCMAGIILQGLKKPYECPAFNNPCTPENPLGATMVSSEGACSAYYRYARDRVSR